MSQETSYPLELAGDLGVHQQLIAKHLKVMEEAEVVEAKKKSSPYGPDRRMYGLTKSVSLSVDFAPHFYGSRLSALQDVVARSKYGRVEEFRGRLDKLCGRDTGADGINPFADLIADIDKSVEDLDNERTLLLYLRSLSMRAAKESIQGKDITPGERMIIHHILNRNHRTVSDIAEDLDIRKEMVKQMLDRLRATYILR